MSVLYSCVKLDSLSAKRLEKLADNLDPNHSRIKCHHMTIQFGRDQDVRKLPLGEEVKLQVVGYAYDEGIQVVQVAFDHPEIEVKNKFPHITVSHTADTKPKESNRLLEETDGGLPIANGATLTGTVGYFRSGNDNNFYIY